MRSGGSHTEHVEANPIPPHPIACVVLCAVSIHPSIPPSRFSVSHAATRWRNRSGLRLVSFTSPCNPQARDTSDDLAHGRIRRHPVPTAIEFPRAWGRDRTLLSRFPRRRAIPVRLTRWECESVGSRCSAIPMSGVMHLNAPAWRCLWVGLCAGRLCAMAARSCVRPSSMSVVVGWACRVQRDAPGCDGLTCSEQSGTCV